MRTPEDGTVVPKRVREIKRDCTIMYVVIFILLV